MRTYASGVARHLHKPVTLNLERQLFKPASFRLGSKARIRGNLKRTLGVIDPRTADQKHIADVFASLGERPLRPTLRRSPTQPELPLLADCVSSTWCP